MPTNENLQKLGRNEVECYCCHKKGTDDINHILITGHFAKYIWHYYAAKLGALYNQTDLRSLLLCWINQPRQNEVYKLLNYILPNFVCWNLWKNRCAVKYGGKKSSVHRVIYGIFKDTMQVVKMVYPNIPWKQNWDSLINILDHCQHQLQITMVGWKKPLEGMYKLNTDGSAIQDSGKIGGGGIVRDHQGKIIYAFSLPLGLGTNNTAKLKSALYGLDWCEQHGYKCIEMEVDSELVCKWINNTISIPWRCQNIVQQIQQISRKLEYFHCTHVYREANGTADLLA